MKKIISYLLVVSLIFSLSSNIVFADVITKGYFSVHGTISGAKGSFDVEVTLPDDVEDVAGIQFEYSLPEGVMLNGDMKVMLGEGWKVVNNRKTVVIYNENGGTISDCEPIFGKTYALLSIPVSVDASVQPGDLNVKLQNFVISSVNSASIGGFADASDSFEPSLDGVITYIQDLSSATVKGIEDKVYNGRARTQSISLVLNGKTLSSTAYSVTYKNNVNAGVATITIKGRGGASGYTGTITKYFNITPPSVGGTLGVSAMSVNSVTLTWNKLSSKAADGYCVYIASSINGKYTLLKRLSGIDKNSYKVSSLASGTTYYFKVCAYKTINNKDYFGGFIGRSKTTEGYKLTTPKSFKAASQTTSSIKLSWKKNKTKIDGYIIYRSTKKTSGFKSIKTLKSTYTSFTNTKLSAGKIYYYKIVAYRNYNGQKCMSDVALLATSTKTKTPSIKSLTPKSSKKMLIKLKSVSGASGYEIYMSTKSSSGFKKIYGGTKNEYTKASLKKGKTYYFKVRAYKTVDGKKIYSAYSSVKSKKATK